MFNGLGTANEAEFRIKPDGSVLIRTHKSISVECDTADVLANSSVSVTTPELTVNCDETTWMGNITHAGNYTMTGVATFNGVIFNTHRHAPSLVPPSNP
ncbi:hypothetical protein D3C75_1179210 [compost metagenome]